jgi:hypothetical protein
MITEAELMARGRGRPPKPEEEGTRGVRLYKDLADMIAAIVAVSDDPKVTAASVVDPLLRPQIKARYERIRVQIEKIERAKADAKKADANGVGD